MTDVSLTIEPVQAFSDNYIWLIRAPGTQECFVVDPGDATPVLDALAKQSLTLTGILVTHHHSDHIGGIETLKQHYQTQVYGPRQSTIGSLTHRVSEGDQVPVLGQRFRVLDVPGHTLDHIAFCCDEQNLLFCGDTLFSAGCGRLFEGTPEQMQQSLNKFKQLPDSTKVFSAHEYTASNLVFAAAVEPENTEISRYNDIVVERRAQNKPTLPSTIGLEKQVNPFLRTTENRIKRAARQWHRNNIGGHDLQDTDVLGVIRKWKDNFQ